MSTPSEWGKFDDSEVVASRKVFEKFAVCPEPTDRYARERWEMASVHSIIFNSLEAVYKNATRIAPNEHTIFLKIAQEMVTNLESHHEIEETVYFPLFERHGVDMESNRKQHAAFLDGVRNTRLYLESIDPKKAATTFSASKFRSLMDAFLPAAAMHMADELATLEPEMLKAKGMTIAELEAATKAVAKSTQSHFDPKVMLPGLLYSRPDGCPFPPLPWLVTGVLAPAFTFLTPKRWKYYWSERRWETVPASQ